MPAVYTCDECGKPAEGENWEGKILCKYHDAENKLFYLREDYKRKRDWLKNTHLKSLSDIRVKIKELEDAIIKYELVYNIRKV